MKSSIARRCSSKYTLLLIFVIIFFLTITTFAIHKVIKKNQVDDASFIMKTMHQMQQNNTEKLQSTFLNTVKRDISIVPSATNITKHPPNGYYEEQRPVVVHAETKPILSYRRPPYGPPHRDATNVNPYYGDNDDDDYGGAEETDNVGDDFEYQQRPPVPKYSDESQESNEGEDTSADQENTGAEVAAEGRAATAQNHQYDSYYRQWHYATAAPEETNRKNDDNVAGNRKLPPMNQNREPSYVAYEDNMNDYDYPMPTNIRTQQQQQQQQQQHYPRPLNERPPEYTTDLALMGKQPNQKQQQQHKQKQKHPARIEHNENTLISTLKNLKTMWDIYQAFSTAWNTIAEHRQKQQPQQQIPAQQQLKRRPQSRINSKKPPKFDNNNSTTTNATANARVKAKAKTTKTTTTTTTSTESALTDVAIATTSATDIAANSKVEPRLRGSKGDAETKDEVGNSREKREERYIKGDPLKGYYDFVITEGSYKFWAAFQTGTALLIIYSTFAAIYYSKVNPLVSDYDYTDYLGGARSLSGGDLDFVDDSDSTSSASTKLQRRTSWSDWMPRTGHSLKFIFDAIDKLPLDDGAEAETTEQKQAVIATATAASTTAAETEIVEYSEENSDDDDDDDA